MVRPTDVPQRGQRLSSGRKAGRQAVCLSCLCALVKHANSLGGLADPCPHLVMCCLTHTHCTRWCGCFGAGSLCNQTFCKSLPLLCNTMPMSMKAMKQSKSCAELMDAVCVVLIAAVSEFFKRSECVDRQAGRQSGRKPKHCWKRTRWN